MLLLTESCLVPFCPIYLDDTGDLFAIVDEIDYAWAVQWKWRAKYSKDRSNGRPLKAYATRSGRIGGARGRNVSIFLHKQILVRTGVMPPTSAHIIGDHKDGNSLNCRRGNLRWATPQQNVENYAGSYASQMRLAFLTNSFERLATPERKYKR